MDCRNALQLINLSPASFAECDAELELAFAHLEHCDSCQRIATGLQQDDLRLGQALNRVEIPEGLLERLLVTVESHEAPTPRPGDSPPSVTRTGPRISATLLASVLLIAIGGLVWWNLPASGPNLIPFQAALTQLQAKFSDPEMARSTWETLPDWNPIDGTLELGPLDSLARRLNRYSPKGIDLNLQPGIEAVAFQFSSGNARGVLIVLPGTHVLPSPQTEPSPSGQFLSWSSPAGDQSYICFVHSGRVEDVLDLLKSA
jgi:hypothetical protein